MPRASPSDSASSAPRKSLRILVVEDDEDSREMMVTFLRLLGNHAIDATETAEEALDCLRGELSYDLMFTDVGLPGMDGIEMVDRAVKEGLIELANVVICSAHMSPKWDVRAKGAQCIPKPLDTNKIMRTVRLAALSTDEIVS